MPPVGNIQNNGLSFTAGTNNILGGSLNLNAQTVIPSQKRPMINNTNNADNSFNNMNIFQSCNPALSNMNLQNSKTDYIIKPQKYYLIDQQTFDELEKIYPTISENPNSDIIKNIDNNSDFEQESEIYKKQINQKKDEKSISDPKLDYIKCLSLNITIKNPQQIKASDINSNKTINQNSFSSFIYDNSKEKLLNYNQSNNKVIRNFFEPSSNTPLLSSPALNIPYNNLNESSSQKNEIVTDFKDLSIEEKNIQEIKDNLKDDKNELNNPSINLSNNNFNQINNNLLFNQQSSLIKTKSNLISNNIKEHKPSDKYSQYMFEQINKIRINPRNYISKLKKLKNV